MGRGQFTTNGVNPLNTNVVKGAPPKHSFVPSDHSTVPVVVMPSNGPLVTVPVKVASEGLFATLPNANDIATWDAVCVFQVSINVPVAVALTFAVVCVMKRVQFEGLLNRIFPDTLAPVTDPAQLLTLAPMTEMIGRTRAVLPYLGSAGDSVAVP